MACVAINFGGDFAVSHSELARYTVTFDVPFRDMPVVTALTFFNSNDGTMSSILPFHVFWNHVSFLTFDRMTHELGDFASKITCCYAAIHVRPRTGPVSDSFLNAERLDDRSSIPCRCPTTLDGLF